MILVETAPTGSQEKNLLAGVCQYAFQYVMMMMPMMMNYPRTRPGHVKLASTPKRPQMSGILPRVGRGDLQHTTSEVAHKAAFEEKRTWVDPQLRP